MRNIVFALILANLGFAAWQHWYAEAPPQIPPGDREFGDIVLAAEFAETNPPVERATVRIEQAFVDSGSEPAGAAADAGSESGETQISAVEFIDPADFQPAPIEAANAGETGAAETQADRREDSEPAVAAAEPDEAEVEVEVALADTAAQPEADIVCMSVGPFRELSQVSAAAANLREDGRNPRQRAGEGEIWSGYWVYIERIESVAAAREMIESLHADGLSDAYIIPNSDSGTLISLGVFSEIIRASRVRERVRRLGLDATIADRVRRATVYWIDIDLPEGALLDFERLQPAGRIIRLEQRPCDEVVL